MRVLGIIPARYASSRLPGKPLADIHGKPMIQHVYEAAQPAVDALIVATDDERIYQAVIDFGGTALMTSVTHQTGTNRCLEAYQIWHKQGNHYDVVLNLQGDEPQIDAEEVALLAGLFKDPDCTVGTLVKKIERQAELDNRSGCFVVLNKQDEALYFSRAVIPVVRNAPYEEWLTLHPFYKHLGLYGFRPASLEAFAIMPSSPLELAEKLEQNRWLENGGRIKVAFARKESLSVDTPEDLSAVRLAMAHE